MFEYLRSIGHPASAMFVDPRETILKIWQVCMLCCMYMCLFLCVSLTY